MTIKQKIISLVETKFFDTSNPDPKTEIYNMPQWDKWKGIKFDDGTFFYS